MPSTRRQVSDPAGAESKLHVPCSSRGATRLRTHLACCSHNNGQQLHVVHTILGTQQPSVFVQKIASFAFSAVLVAGSFLGPALPATASSDRLQTAPCLQPPARGLNPSSCIQSRSHAHHLHPPHAIAQQTAPELASELEDNLLQAVKLAENGLDNAAGALLKGLSNVPGRSLDENELQLLNEDAGNLINEVRTKALGDAGH